MLGNEPLRESPRLDLTERNELSGVGNGVRPLSIYDQLACEPDVASADFAVSAWSELACSEFVEQGQEVLS